MSFIKSLLASTALLSAVLAHPSHGHNKRAEPQGTILTSCTVPGTVALTFDDGPYIYTETLLDKLEAKGFRATFFQNGNNWESIYNYNSTLKRMITGGHQIASHTWDHKDLATLTNAQVQKEMTDLETAYLNILGFFPYYMRPPFLSTSDIALQALTTLKYVVITIDIDTQDWQNLQVSQEQYSFSNYTAGFNAGGRLSLSHDPYATTVNGYIPELLDWLVSKNMKSVPVGECLGDPQVNWYRKTRSDTYNPYIAVASSSASKSASATSSKVSASASSSSVKPSSVSASASSVKPSSVSASVSKASSVVSVASSLASSKASSAVSSKVSSVASVSPISSKISSVAGSASVSPVSSKVSSLVSSVVLPSSLSSIVLPSKSSSIVVSSLVSSVVSSAKLAAPSGKVSSSGVCGGSKGYVCGPGECCSEYGWCGASTEFCGTGCQIKYGLCSIDESGSTIPTGPTVISPDYSCGGMSGYTCPDSMCCSQYGWCGTGNAYCKNCQAGFGTCN